MTDNLTGTPGPRRWDGEFCKGAKEGKWRVGWAKTSHHRPRYLEFRFFAFRQKTKKSGLFHKHQKPNNPVCSPPPLSIGCRIKVIVILSPIQTFEKTFTTLLTSLPWHSAHFLYNFSQVPLFLALSQLANHVILFLNVFSSSLSYLAFRFSPCPLLDSF